MASFPFTACLESVSLLGVELAMTHSSHWEELNVGLTAEMWSTVEDQIGVHSIDCFQTASSLVDIGIFSEYHFVPVLLSVYQLTHYNIDCLWEEHIRALKQTPNIIEARISIAFDKEAWSDSLETVDLLHLRCLYISPVGALKYFKVPSLEELAPDISGEDTYPPTFPLSPRPVLIFHPTALPLVPYSPYGHQILTMLPLPHQTVHSPRQWQPKGRDQHLDLGLTLPNYPEGLMPAPQLHPYPLDVTMKWCGKCSFGCEITAITQIIG
ncbi:hypothetical protein DFH08DRAFT_822181 [Mycena albidolilacea]|uniref:Uncharacterized protein n=1 Tax=Mycena albidolilacea TaxID=1033008 RepID=A0AAD6Z9H1_9AGAR|nr:hypothetical protein DFH08DRAFT_822181 [Mycena albidolilacea]